MGRVVSPVLGCGDLWGVRAEWMAVGAGGGCPRLEAGEDAHFPLGAGEHWAAPWGTGALGPCFSSRVIVELRGLWCFCRGRLCAPRRAAFY
jgi:hypothetical protein